MLLSRAEFITWRNQIKNPDKMSSRELRNEVRENRERMMSDTNVTLSDEEMVAWANASIDRVRELEAEVERLTAENDILRRDFSERGAIIERLQARVEHLEALEQRLRAAAMEDFDRIAELEAENEKLRDELIQARGLSAFRQDSIDRLQARVEALEGAAKEFVYSYGSGTEGKDDERPD